MASARGDKGQWLRKNRQFYCDNPRLSSEVVDTWKELAKWDAGKEKTHPLLQYRTFSFYEEEIIEKQGEKPVELQVVYQYLQKNNLLKKLTENLLQYEDESKRSMYLSSTSPAVLLARALTDVNGEYLTPRFCAIRNHFFNMINVNGYSTIHNLYVKPEEILAFKSGEEINVWTSLEPSNLLDNESWCPQINNAKIEIEIFGTERRRTKMKVIMKLIVMTMKTKKMMV